MPDTVVSDTVVPDTVVADRVVPATVVPYTLVPDTAVPDGQTFCDLLTLSHTFLDFLWNITKQLLYFIG